MLKWVFQPQLHILYSSLFSLWLWLWCYMVLRCSFEQAMLQVEVFAPWVIISSLSATRNLISLCQISFFFFFLFLLCFFFPASQTNNSNHIELLPVKRFLWFFYITNLFISCGTSNQILCSPTELFLKRYIFLSFKSKKEKKKRKKRWYINITKEV